MFMKDMAPRLKGRRRVERAIRRSNAPTSDTAWAEIASRLLEFQQELEAWDRLYNEELCELRKEFSQLTAHERGALNESSGKGNQHGGFASVDGSRAAANGEYE
jgi:hypothetical protein